MTTNAEPNDELWDANDVARYLKASRSWVYHQAEAGLTSASRRPPSGDRGAKPGQRRSEKEGPTAPA